MSAILASSCNRWTKNNITKNILQLYRHRYEENGAENGRACFADAEENFQYHQISR
jgi:hypothetical protein